MRLTPRLMLFGCGLALLAGCESSGARMYYQTRYIPTSSDWVFSKTEQTKWTGDRTIYELPSNPPGIEDEYRPRKECARPGPRFKTPGIAAYGNDRAHSNENNEVTAFGGWDDRPLPDKGTGPYHNPPIAGMEDRDYGTGVREPNGMIPINGPETRPQSVTGAGLDRIPARAPDKLGDRPKDDYCLPDPLNEK